MTHLTIQVTGWRVTGWWVWNINQYMTRQTTYLYGFIGWWVHESDLGSWVRRSDFINKINN